MIVKARMQTVWDKTVISDLCWYASDQYRLLIIVGAQDYSRGLGIIRHNIPSKLLQVTLSVFFRT